MSANAWLWSLTLPELLWILDAKNYNELGSFSLQICECILYSYSSEVLISKYVYPCHGLTGWCFSSEDVVGRLLLHKGETKDNCVVCYEYIYRFTWSHLNLAENPRVFVLKSTCRMAALTFISCGWEFRSWCGGFLCDSHRCRRHIWGQLREYKAERSAAIRSEHVNGSLDEAR